MTDPDALFDAAPPRRKPWIDTPGWYDGISDVDYHADPVVGGSMSSTGARTLARKTPEHFDWDRRHGRPDTKDLDYGKVAHARVLGRGTEVVVIKGTGKDVNAWRTDADKAAVAKAKAAGKTPIRYRDHLEIEAMAARLRAHRTAGPLLARKGRHEQVGVWQDPVTGVWCRFMADFLPDVPDGARQLVVDYKTCRDASEWAFAKAMDDHGYDQQGDWYETGVDALDPRDLPAQFVLIAQEKTAPYGVLVAYLDDLARARGAVRNAKARALYARCTESGEWPGYPTAPVELSLPGYSARTAEDEIAAAETGATHEQEVTPA
jgi:hypothetical protein